MSFIHSEAVGKDLVKQRDLLLGRFESVESGSPWVAQPTHVLAYSFESGGSYSATQPL